MPHKQEPKGGPFLVQMVLPMVPICDWLYSNPNVIYQHVKSEDSFCPYAADIDIL